MIPSTVMRQLGFSEIKHIYEKLRPSKTIIERSSVIVKSSDRVRCKSHQHLSFCEKLRLSKM